MKTMLIAVSSETLTEELVRTFLNEYKVYTCSRGDDALRLLQDLKPDTLIINLSLSHITGLSVLQQTDYTPPVIVALSFFLSDYILHTAQDIGVGAIIRPPFTIACVKSHINRLLSYQQQSPLPGCPEKGQNIKV